MRRRVRTGAPRLETASAPCRTKGTTITCHNTFLAPLTRGQRAVTVVRIVSAGDANATVELRGQASVSLGVS